MKVNTLYFEKTIQEINSLPEHLLETAYEIDTEYSFEDLLDFCVKNNCFTKEQSRDLLSLNQLPIFYEKMFYKKIGLTEETRNKFNELYVEKYR